MQEQSLQTGAYNRTSRTQDCNTSSPVSFQLGDHETVTSDILTCQRRHVLDHSREFGKYVRDLLNSILCSVLGVQFPNTTKESQLESESIAAQGILFNQRFLFWVEYLSDECDLLICYAPHILAGNII